MRERDERAEFDALLREQRRPLRRIVEQVSGSADPDDVAQELALRAFERRGRVLALAHDERCRWSRTVARNIAARMFRDRSATDLVAAVPDDALVTPDVLDLHLAADRRREIGAALATLDPETRHVVVARAVHGTPYATLAAELGVPEPALRQRYRRACARLRTLLTGVGGVVVPLRRAARGARPTAAGTAAALAGVLAVMVPAPGVVSAPGNGGSPLPPGIASSADRHAARSRAASPPARPRTVSTAAVRTADGADRDDSAAPREPRRTRVCVGDACLSSPGDPRDPGDEITVDAPKPVGPAGVKQNRVPACDVVPTAGPVRCERQE